MFSTLTNRSSRGLSLALVVFLLGALLAGCAEDVTVDETDFGQERTIDYLIAQGWIALNNGDLSGAVSAFNEAKIADASSLEAYLGLGYAFAAQNDAVNAQSSFGNVIALAPVLDLTDAYRDTVLAETYAGLAAAYLANDEYESAVEMAIAGEAIWGSWGSGMQRHRFLVPTYELADLTVVKAEAYYLLEEYDMTVSVLNTLDNTFVSSSSTILSVADEAAPVIQLETTREDGIAEADLANTNLIDVEDVVLNGRSYDIVGFDMGENTVQFRGVPVPLNGDTASIDYLYTDDFGLFLSELRDKLSELKQ